MSDNSLSMDNYEQLFFVPAGSGSQQKNVFKKSVFDVGIGV